MLSQANVEMMLEYLPLSQFKAIYVVDLCASLCKQARLRVQDKGWANVHVIEGDACTFAPPMQATAVTFSYSLSSALPHRHNVPTPLCPVQPWRACSSRHWQWRAACNTRCGFGSELRHDSTLTGWVVGFVRSDPAVPLGGGPGHHIPGPDPGAGGRHRLLRLRQVRPAAAPDVVGAPLLLAVRWPHHRSSCSHATPAGAQLLDVGVHTQLV